MQGDFAISTNILLQNLTGFLITTLVPLELNLPMKSCLQSTRCQTIVIIAV